MVSMDSCSAELMKPQVFITTISGLAASASIRYPSAAKIPSISSESTVFLAQPRLINWILDFGFWILDFGDARGMDIVGDSEFDFDTHTKGRDRSSGASK